MTEYIEKTLITTELPFVMMKYGNYFNERQIEKIVEIVYELENSIEAADVQPVDRWISVNDRLPENDRDVLVYDKVSGMWIAQYDNRWETEEFILDDVTHWQPLPEPPKED